MSLVQQELLILPKQPSSDLVFIMIRCPIFSFLCSVLSTIVCFLFFLFWPMYCLTFFILWLLITFYFFYFLRCSITRDDYASARTDKITKFQIDKITTCIYTVHNNRKLEFVTLDQSFELIQRLT